jgi:nucleoside-diphosphate-sugar epimerase
VTWVVIGAGYVGSRVADVLRARGDEVRTTRRRAPVSLGTTSSSLDEPVILDLASATVDEIATRVRGADVVVLAAPPSDAVGGAEAKLAEAAARERVARIVYVSSTGVYAPAGGAWVDETFATEPVSPSGKARLAAENAIAAGSVPSVLLRAAGIWGPGRGAVERLRAGTYRVIGDGDTYVSRVHVDDLVSAVVASGDARDGGAVYNVADDEPCTSNELVAEAVKSLGLNEPARIGLDQVDADVAGMFTANRRIANGRLKAELGWAPRYPSWNSGSDTLVST